MPESLNFRSGERIDVVDLLEGTNTYTQETSKFAFERAWLDRRSRIIDGFRVRVEDQTSFPGMVTIFNGNALDRDGQQINNEVTVNDSRSVTLLGTALNFYVEIEFTQNPSETDARFFWDPTTSNTPPLPDGSEFSINVTTRLTPDWRIVTPVSTTGFEQTTNPNSLRVPVGVFRTDGSNRIATGGTNPGLVLVRAASVLEADVASGVTALRVIDTRVFPGTLPFTVSVDFGASGVETRTVTSVDLDNSILNVSVATSNAHSAGAIIRVTSGSADLVRDKTDPSDPTLSPLLSPPGHPDPAQRMWQANEVRGTALTTSKETFGSRDDLNLRSLKDYVDFLSAQIREMKFGSPRPEVVNVAPPIVFATRPRYFDAVGGIAGSRSNSLSIGNGTTTFGDFNGTDGDVVLAAAQAALPSTGGTIFIKAGTYTFDTTVSLTKKIRFVGEGKDSVILTSNVSGNPMLSISADTSFEHLTLQKGTGNVIILTVVAAVTTFLEQISFVGECTIDAVAGVVKAYKSSLAASGSSSIFVTINNGVLSHSEFLDCVLTTTSNPCFAGDLGNILVQSCTITANSLFGGGVDNSFTNLRVTNCTMVLSSNFSFLTGTGAVDGFLVSNCDLILTNLAALNSVFFFANTDVTDHITLQNLVINIVGGTSSSGSPSFVLSIQSNSSSRELLIDNLDVAATAGSFIVGVLIDQDTLIGSTRVLNSHFFGTEEMLRLGGTTGSLDTGNIIVQNCTHDNDDQHANTYGIRLVSNPTLDSLLVDNCIFKNYKLNAASGVRLGIEASTTNTSSTNFTVKNCTFENIGYGSATTAAGFYYDATTASNMPHVFNISGNRFISISSNTTGRSAGVYIASSAVTNSLKANISNNYLFSVGVDSTVSGDTVGIFVANASSTSASVVICNNQVYGVASSSASAQGTGIGLDDCNNSLVQGNYIRGVFSPGVTSLLNGCGIRITGSANISNICILDNIVDQASAGSSGTYNINLINTQVQSWAISGNEINTSSTCPAGIYVDGTSAGSTLLDGKIQNNIIRQNDTAALVLTPAYGIRCILGGASHILAVDSNTIEETTLDATASQFHQGIRISGNTTGGDTYGLSVSNNTLTAPKTGTLVSSGARFGIVIDAVAQTKVVGNLVSWNEPSVLEGFGIVLTSTIGGSWSGHLVSGNFVRTDNNAGAGVEMFITTGNMINGFLDSNQFGESSGGGSLVGTISPSSAAGGWLYGTNMI